MLASPQAPEEQQAGQMLPLFSRNSKELFTQAAEEEIPGGSGDNPSCQCLLEPALIAYPGPYSEDRTQDWI